MISTEMTIWLAVVGVASVGMLLGIFALTKRINAIDERLFDLQRLEIALSRGFSAAVANESSEVTAIKLHLYQLKRQPTRSARLGATNARWDVWIPEQGITSAS
jgi:hypothetical protein